MKPLEFPDALRIVCRRTIQQHMNEKRRILRLFAESLSGFEEHFESDRQLWEDENGGITMCGVFSSLSNFVHDNHERLDRTGASVAVSVHRGQCQYRSP